MAGASDDRHKYGHKVYVSYLQNKRKAYPINPHTKTVLDNDAYPDIASLPEKVESISIITPPQVTEQIIDDAIACGVKNIWMQPGAESRSAINKGQRSRYQCYLRRPLFACRFTLP